MEISILNGRVIDPASGLDAVTDVHVSAGRFVALGQPPAGFQAQRRLDANGLVVCAGLVDVAARLREPGYEYLATLETEMEAAVAGGITSLAIPPDTDPPLDEPGLVEMLKSRAQQLNQARVYPLGALTLGLKGELLTEMAELRDAGCVGFSLGNTSLPNTKVLARAMEYAASFGFSVWLRPQDPYLGRSGVAHDGPVATRLGLSPVPENAELIALSTVLHLVEDIGTRVHFCRLSSGKAVDLVRQAKARGLPVSCDVAIHQTLLTDEGIGEFDPNFHLAPPLRSEADRQAIAAGLADGTIDVACSDHTPVDEDAKQLPFAESEAGATGLELLLPLTLRWAAEQQLPLAEALARITLHPARLLNIQAGRINVGLEADLCVFDPEQAWQVNAASLISQGKNTPFLGTTLKGRVVYTLAGGSIVFEREPASAQPL